MATSAIAAPAARRGRPPKVSPEAILDAVDRKRHGDWTMASIAAELGVSEPAIYYHYPSKHALLVALGARVIQQLPVPAPTDDWEEWLGTFAQGALEFCRAHPFLSDVELSAIAVQQTASVRLLDELLQQLVAYGFAADDALIAVSGVLVVVQQFAHAPAFDVDADRPHLAVLALDSGATLAADVYQADRYWEPDEAFRRMLRVVLAGVRTELAPHGGVRSAKR
jgi:AcrR family transcriptional regulator